ncbi:MAG: DUF433 domain-containing protein [Chloroflexota bacterium]|nr:DUF433 domain-containing protein [Chloroflexota bacterium]
MGDTLAFPPYLISPRYGFADADYLANVTRGTAKRWLVGHAYEDNHGQRVVQPPITPGVHREEGVSFADLVEIAAIGRLKEAEFSLRMIREIVRNCQEILGVPRPLTTLRFKTGGGEIFVDRGDVLLEVGRKKRMQAWKEVLEPFLQELDYDTHQLAVRWWPLGRSTPVVIDPEYGFGFPVVAKSGVRTEIILERFRAGDLNEQISADFNIEPVDVERALQFELQRAA